MPARSLGPSPADRYHGAHSPTVQRKPSPSPCASHRRRRSVPPRHPPGFVSSPQIARPRISRRRGDLPCEAPACSSVPTTQIDRPPRHSTAARPQIAYVACGMYVGLAKADARARPVYTPVATNT
ncbi:hypothetical protein C8R44DRAFT_885752 [Mycena epipterygia]|nr:hypothetical protein C8R44DRAFT_885752 [Mycena epipterygia]